MAPTADSVKLPVLGTLYLHDGSEHHRGFATHLTIPRFWSFDYQATALFLVHSENTEP